VWPLELPSSSDADSTITNSTGGIIALGLGINNWSVEECITRFEELCERAFTRRVGGNIAVISWFIENYNHFKYETHPLEEALKSAFTESQYLFGGPRPTDTPNSDIKVGVTATSSAGSSVLLTNYNRLCAEKCEYEPMIWCNRCRDTNGSQCNITFRGRRSCQRS